MCIYAQVRDAHAIIDLTAASGALSTVQDMGEVMLSQF